MSKYNNAREQVLELLTRNNDLANPRLFNGIVKIIDGLEKEDEWLPFDPENIPEAKEGWCLLIKSITGNTYTFNVNRRKWEDNEGDVFYEYAFDKKTNHYKLVPLT